ncbi:unnamed protein product [Pleuronectes platessa]|uniref:Uncharacterized protein n=1 Tax=Pleuronectes platessa TaxID=8262 RepID=A0A9N7VR42_PLEPL|nr:unnamed protein product [Pleuronectes platessa]
MRDATCGCKCADQKPIEALRHSPLSACRLRSSGRIKTDSLRQPSPRIPSRECDSPPPSAHPGAATSGSTGPQETVIAGNEVSSGGEGASKHRSHGKPERHLAENNFHRFKSNPNLIHNLNQVRFISNPNLIHNLNQDRFKSNPNLIHNQDRFKSNPNLIHNLNQDRFKSNPNLIHNQDSFMSNPNLIHNQDRFMSNPNLIHNQNQDRVMSNPNLIHNLNQDRFMSNPNLIHNLNQDDSCQTQTSSIT